MGKDYFFGDIAESAEPVDLSKYTLQSPLAIAHHLLAITKQKYMVAVFGNHGKTHILTRFLHVDAPNERLIFDWGGDIASNEDLLNSERNVFMCSPDGIKTQFVCQQVRRVGYEGNPAFEVDFPKSLIKLQRREFFRVRTPVANPIVCTLMDYPGEALELPVFDISLGGLGLWLPEPTLHGFEVGTRYQDCHLHLGAYGQFSFGIEIRHKLSTQHRNGQEAVRIGCRYLAIKPVIEVALQRYIGQLERERRAMIG